MQIPQKLAARLKFVCWRKYRFKIQVARLSSPLPTPMAGGKWTRRAPALFRFDSLRMCEKLWNLTLSALAWGSLCDLYFDKIRQIHLKPALVEHWLAIFVVTCKLGLAQGSQPGAHVPPGVHLPIWRGTFKVSDRREKYIYIPFPSKYLHIYYWMIIWLLSSASMNNHDKIFCHERF